MADLPRLSEDVVVQDVLFRSPALDRDMRYRAVLPKKVPVGKKLPVLYLLHGGGGTFRDWSNYSDVAPYAGRGLILVMPEGDYSYYVNAVDRPKDRYEDYIVADLRRDVETRFPAAVGREQRAIAGVSMGGFGAVVLCFRHPEIYSFVAALSPALDVPSRPFSVRRWGQWRDYRAIFGPWNGAMQKAEDPLLLVKTADAEKMPYLLLSCGDKEGLLDVNQRFAAALKRRQIQYEFHKVSGGHDWKQWNAQIPAVMETMAKRFNTN